VKQGKLKAEKREKKKRMKMKVSGRSVFKIREIVLKRSRMAKGKEKIKNS
jgi:hypothetical protein